jgi:hypothetical protein
MTSHAIVRTSPSTVKPSEGWWLSTSWSATLPASQTISRPAAGAAAIRSRVISVCPYAVTRLPVVPTTSTAMTSPSLTRVSPSCGRPSALHRVSRQSRANRSVVVVSRIPARMRASTRACDVRSTTTHAIPACRSEWPREQPGWPRAYNRDLRSHDRICALSVFTPPVAFRARRGRGSTAGPARRCCSARASRGSRR